MILVYTGDGAVSATMKDDELVDIYFLATRCRGQTAFGIVLRLSDSTSVMTHDPPYLSS